MIVIQCKFCKKDFKVWPYEFKSKERKHCSKQCDLNTRKTWINDKSFKWKGNNVTLSAIHTWLKQNFGKADKCENLNCIGISKVYDWCKKKNHKYLKKRTNFIMLCRSCHRKYDMTRLKKKKAIKNLIWYKQNVTTTINN